MAGSQLPALPTEIYHAILSFVEVEDRANFANSSKQCYLLAFPARFRGIIIPDSEHEMSLRPFTNSGWLEPLTHCIRSATFAFQKISSLLSLLPCIAIFPKVKHLTIELSGTDGLERNAYVATISLLSRLAQYDGIEHLTLRWSRYPSRERQYVLATCLDHYISEIRDGKSQYESRGVSLSTMGFIGDLRPGPLPDSSYILRDKEEQRTYSTIFALLTQEEKDFLGPFISYKDLPKTLKELPFPKNISSFNVDIPESETHHFLLFFNCKADVSLHFKDFNPPIRDPNQPTKIVQLPSVKRLYLSFTYGKLQSLSEQFPNLESLFISLHGGFSVQDFWKDSIPNFPNIRELSLMWPPKTRNSNFIADHVQQDLEKGFIRGKYKNLRHVRITSGSMKREGHFHGGPKGTVVWKTLGHQSDPELPPLELGNIIVSTF